jgi:hypothetical protein
MVIETGWGSLMFCSGQHARPRQEGEYIPPGPFTTLTMGSGKDFESIGPVNSTWVWGDKELCVVRHTEALRKQVELPEWEIYIDCRCQETTEKTAQALIKGLSLPVVFAPAKPADVTPDYK